MKIAPIIHEIDRVKKQRNGLTYRLVHTGQHYDDKMSQSFFRDLNIPSPDVNLNAGGGSQAEQTGAIMVGFEKDLLNNPCDILIVVGDVTSTLACSIVAKKAGVLVAHVEAGIRSGDLSMPEEINRMVTDSITDFFFTTSQLASEKLRNLGILEERIYFVGNTMIDTLIKNISNLRKPEFYDELGLKNGNYLVLTLHRPANVDEEYKLKQTLEAIEQSADGMPVLFPLHPRTKTIIDRLGLSETNLIFVAPLGYLEFNYLVRHSKGVITDSGGITEETTFMGVPCLTLRDNTERPETIDIGTNELVGTDPSKIRPFLEKLISNDWKKGGIPPLWDGATSKRIVEALLNLDLT